MRTVLGSGCDGKAHCPDQKVAYIAMDEEACLTDLAVFKISSYHYGFSVMAFHLILNIFIHNKN